MNWINLVWLGVGFGTGVICDRLWRQPSKPPRLRLTASPESNSAGLEQVRQLELAYQMATEMSQFKGGYLVRISHELRSPLNGLIGILQLILAGLCDSPEEEREFLVQANTSARTMVGVLDSVLNAARIQQGTIPLTIQPIQLAAIFQEVHSLTQLQAKDRNIRLHLVPPDQDLYVQVDLPQFRQILLHLLDSAILRLPSEGIIVSASLSTEGKTIHIWINDHCPLADRSEPVNLLQPDMPTNSVLPSPGLNLLIAQTLLQSMQGRLEVVPLSTTLPESAEAGSGEVFTQIQISIPGYRQIPD
ncbi:HAMP domain-containing histidine kinase [Leptothermofonsia sichuanensis E412]|uniref:sensor histidine kinase n=1 Tax=Leptothermofonsia sichuanensis TaxID=2917832 RepID=UPI001CA634F2|nr:HAMP domain-containing sensor histidine kinase [Leptothermofonsia sichuanensis]QZZ21802.1 HAMP domain-containing histidine kinase [Leptothermofonsia sichuanensis E412]